MSTDTQQATAQAHQAAMATAAEPPFHDELTEVWGARWGAEDEVGVLRRVLVRQPGQELAAVREDAWDPERGALVDPDGRWYWTDRSAPDLDLVHEQHAGLVAALQAEGIEVDVAPPLGGGYVKAVYTRDPSITVPGGAIVGRMGVRMRRGEEPHTTRTLANAGMPILGTITGTGTLEGGSFVKLRRDLALLGTSIRCNRAGAEQLRTLLALQGVELRLVPIPGYSIHLDLHLAMVDAERALVDPTGLPFDLLEDLKALGIETITAAPGEEWGLNLLCLRPGRVLMAEGSPRTGERLERAGIEVVTVPYDEIQKNGGGVHCSTIELVRDPAR
ncbi:dimethylarginine dimethylaminohydrolase family protein [Patulibacter americanus]|uniref:dimethylarginine dimethylaminohydrolase family protein n=1 Tax=Patulibacter americanus TaxID=588672 RepID=UPI0003B39857|nr:arginine deiminase family protein [Patulibacter americanus]